MEDNEYSSNESDNNYGPLDERESPPIPLTSVASTQSLSESLFSQTSNALEADVSGELGEIAPTFGDVLMSVGRSIADSQASLDTGLVESARVLSETKIKVVSEVIQELNEDGLPDPGKTEMIENDVSLIHFVNPTAHEWKHVALSMDLNVGAMDHERGMQFTKSQRSKGDQTSKIWGYQGWFNRSDQTSQSDSTRRFDQETDWARGQVRMDALIQPRTMERFATPSEVTIGPQIYFSQGTINETIRDGSVSERSLDILIRIRKANGEANPNVDIQLETGPLNISYSNSDGFTGSRTNGEGEIMVTVTRVIPNARFLRPLRSQITARLGEMKQSTVVSL